MQFLKNIGKKLRKATDRLGEESREVGRETKARVSTATTKTKGLASTALSRILYRTPLSGRDPKETEIDLETRKNALKYGPVGSTGYETALRNAYIAKNPSEIVDVGEVKTITKVGKTAVKKAVQAFNPKADELGETINRLNEQFVSKPTTANKKALESAKDLYRRETQAGFVDTGQIADDAKKAKNSAEVQLIDRFAPIKNFVKGTNLSADQNPYIAARNFAGRFGKIQNRLDDLSEILTPAKADLPVAKEYGLLERYQELYERGIRKFPSKLTIEEINTRKATLEKTLGSKLPQVKNFLENLRGYSDNLLVEARDAGVISPESYAAIVKNNEKYIPLQRLEYLADQVDNIPRGKNSFNVAAQNIVRTITGSEKEIVDPIESIVRNTHKTIGLIERNKVATKVADLAGLPGFEDLVIPLKSEIPAGMDKLSVLRNGIKEEYAIPKELADSLKGLNEANIDIISRVAGFTGGLLRAGATSLNAAFIPANAIRDYQTATLVSKVGFTPLDWIKGFAEAIKRGDDYKAFLESGASYSGFFEQNKKLSKTVRKLTESKALTVAKTIVNPIKLLQTVGETIELAPRLGVFKKSLKKGLSTAEAAFNAREATVDFAKSGSAMKVANLWIPFLNARTQGTINVLKAVKNRPVRSALVIGGMIQVPIVASYFHNTTFHKDIWDDIAQFEKDNNFIIIYGDEKDADGNPTQIIKIPKGDVGKVFGNPMENFLAFLGGNDPKAIDQVMIETFSSLSPVDFAKDGELSGQTLISGVLPPTIKAGAETVTNKNLFIGRDIVPRSLEDVSPELQYKETTSPIAIKLGQFFGISPLKLENFVGTQFGGLGRQALNPGEAPTQITGRFSGARGGEKEQKDFEKLDDLERGDADERVLTERKVQKLLEELKDLPTGQRQERVQDLLERGEIDASIIEELGQQIVEDAKGFSSFEKAFKSKPNDVKAKFLVDKLDSLPPEERKAYFQDLMNKGLISENLLKQITEEIKSRAKDN